MSNAELNRIAARWNVAGFRRPSLRRMFSLRRNIGAVPPSPDAQKPRHRFSVSLANDILRRTDRRSSLNSEAIACTEATDYTMSTQAFESFATISALICGFAVSTFTFIGEKYGGSDRGEYGLSVSIRISLILIALVVAFSSYATIYMSMTSFYMRRLAGIGSRRRLRKLHDDTRLLRASAKQATVLAYVLYISSLAVLAFDMLGRNLATKIAVMILLGCGALLILVTVHLVQKKANVALSLGDIPTAANVMQRFSRPDATIQHSPGGQPRGHDAV